MSAPEAATVDTIAWAHFVDALAEMCQRDLGAISGETLIADVVSSQLERTVLFTAVSKLGFGMERPLFDASETIGDLFAWVQQRRIGKPDTHDLRLPPAGTPTESPVWLRPVQQSDVSLLYRAAQSPRSAFRWRYRGALPPPTQQFVDLLHEGVLAQFIVEAKADGSAQGLVVAYDAIHEYGTCCVAFQRIGPSVGGGEMFIGMYHLIEYVFSRWSMRKLYADVPEYNLEYIGGSFGPLREEARLRECVYYDGRYWDRVFFVVERESWESWAQVARPYLQEGLYREAW